MRYLIRIIVIIIIISAAVVGTQIYGYSSLKTDFSASNVSPKFNASPESIVAGLLSVFQGNMLGAVSSFVQGLQVDGTLTLKNGSIFPLYLPNMQHKIEINGTPTQSAISTNAMWIAPEGSKTAQFSILIEKTNLPAVALNILGSGGNIDITVESSAVLAGFTITKTSQKQENLTNSLSSYTSSSGGSNQTTSTEPTVTSYRFSPNPTMLGNVATGSITLSGGSAGTYILRLMQDISFAPDQFITSYSISHDGTTTNKNFSFTPTSNGSYHLDLQDNGNTIWSQPNDSSRLVITNPSAPAFSVNSYDFSPNPITLGNSVNAAISMTGGSAGTYTLNILKDISLFPDQIITSYTITSDGTNINQSFSFTPPAAGAYHMNLVFNNTTLWSQPNDTTRLTVTSNLQTTTTTNVTTTHAALSVPLYSFSPNPVTLGNSVNASISMSGGTAGTYTLNIWKDINLAPDQLVTGYSIIYNGTSTTQSFSFTPAATGSYHMNLVFDGTTLWSQPSDATRLTVSSPLPTVKILNVDIPSVVIVGQTYNYNVTLNNSGTTQASVTLNIDSSVSGHVSSTSVNVPANSNLNVPITTTFTPAGVRTVTYTVLSNSQVLDTLTKTIQANNPIAFSVTSYSFSPNPTTLGHTVTFSISMSGGTSGTYTLRLIKDVSLFPDQLVTSYSIIYDGTTTSKSFSFTPASSGSYHLDLQFSGTTLWSQPNDATRLKVN